MFLQISSTTNWTTNFKRLNKLRKHFCGHHILTLNENIIKLKKILGR